MADAERLDPALLPVGERHEIAQLDDLLVAEVQSKALPERVVRALRVPDERARVEQRRLLALVVAIGALELEQFVVVDLGKSLLSTRERPLRASVVTVDRLRDVDATEFLQRMLDQPGAEGALPVRREGAQHGGHVGSDRLALRARRAVARGVLEVPAELGVLELLDRVVADPRQLVPPQWPGDPTPPATGSRSSPSETSTPSGSSSSADAFAWSSSRAAKSTST